MKTFTFILILITSFTLSWTGSPKNDKEDIFLEDLTSTYKSNFIHFKKEVTKLALLASQPAHTLNPLILQEQITSTRLSYKRIEFLFDYHKTAYNYTFVNGPPLPKLDEDFSLTGLTPPNGLQTLDELIFSNDPISELNQIKKLASELQKKIDKLALSHLNIKLRGRSTMQALRSGMVRVFALGLTGFDTPGSGNALKESEVSMKAMGQAFASFGKNLRPEAQRLFSEITIIFQNAQKELSVNPDFDRFDRMTFLKEVINPLYKKIFLFQKANKIPTGGFKYNAQNFESENIFDEDFLNLDFYSATSFTSLNNPATIQLGKMLFYDPLLSKELTMSCASCHDPKLAFTDGLPKSKTNNEHAFTKRHAPTLIDAAFSTRFFWDLREYTLEKQVNHVINDTLEFNTSFREIAERLEKSEVYTELFEEQYGRLGSKRTIKRRSISNAIAAYVNSLTSFDSEFDKYVRNESKSYPENAIRGFNIFMGKAACGTCHFVPTFSGLVPPFYMEAESEVLGITLGLDTLNPVMDTDLGRRLNGKKKEDFDHFRNSMKTVTLRNIELTAPYMHNGLFDSLEEVIEFYDHGGGAGMGLDIDNQTLAPDRLNLSTQEKSDLISFMHTLTDTTGLTNAHVILPKITGYPEWDDRVGY